MEPTETPEMKKSRESSGARFPRKFPGAENGGQKESGFSRRFFRAVFGPKRIYGSADFAGFRGFPGFAVSGNQVHN